MGLTVAGIELLGKVPQEAAIKIHSIISQIRDKTEQPVLDILEVGITLGREQVIKEMLKLTLCSDNGCWKEREDLKYRLREGP